MKKKFKKVEPYIWILPSVLLMAIFILVPIIFVFRMALSDVSKAGLIKGFAGLENFRKVTSSPVFAMVLKNTLVWTVAVVGISTLLGFILAILLNNEFKGRKLARAVVVFPWATTLIVQASIWKFIIDTDYGTLNTLLMKLGIIDHAVNWTPTAGAYFAWEIACGIFVTIPFVTFTVLSGLQSIDASYYEAAAVDGASYWQKMFQITIPLVRPNLTISTILNIIYVFNSFPIIWTITKGDPANPYRHPGYLSVQTGLLQRQTGTGSSRICYRLPDSSFLRQPVHGFRTEERRRIIWQTPMLQSRKRIPETQFCVYYSM